EPSGLVVGEASDLRDLAAVLDKVKATMVAAYSRKSGKPRAEVEAIMAAETWFTAAEAVAAGFADRIGQPIALAATFDPARFARKRPAIVPLAEFAQRFWANQRRMHRTLQ